MSAATSSTMETNPATIYQLKIALRSRPKVWRRVQIPGTFSFWDLHTVIQDSFGWNNSHLHKFEIRKQLIGPPSLSAIGKTIPESTVNISDYFKTAGDAAYYEYDFGFSWEHDIIFEKILPAVKGIQYPKCIEGEMACPPEDVNESFDMDDFDSATFDRKLVKFDRSKKYVFK